MGNEKAVSVYLHARAPLTLGASRDGQMVWFTCPKFAIEMVMGRSDKTEVAVYLGCIEEAVLLADAIYAHCRKQAAAHYARAEAMATVPTAAEEKTPDAQ